MFTGIIECIGEVVDIEQDGSNISLWMKTEITNELKIDQSVAHNGVCLTVVDIDASKHCVTAVEETIEKTNLKDLQIGDKVNIERALKANGRLDGHFVQGHVDAKGICTSKEQKDGSWLFCFKFPEEFASLVIEKGSICINGVSLTAFNVTKDELTVTIIPYTYEHTSFNTILEGTEVNLEFDVLGKYMQRYLQLQKN